MYNTCTYKARQHGEDQGQWVPIPCWVTVYGYKKNGESVLKVVVSCRSTAPGMCPHPLLIKPMGGYEVVVDREELSKEKG